MAITIAPYALTSLTKVKLYLGITDSSQDTLLTQIINGVTDYIENFCGGRRFLKTVYASTDDNTIAGNATAELHDTYHNRKVFFNQYPVVSVEKVQYRGGTLSSPQWLTYDPNGYLLYNKEGYMEFFGRLPKVKQGLRFSYTAGYLIDFPNEGTATHTLPMDITMVATSMAQKIYKYMDNQGMISVSTEGQSITWDRSMVGANMTDADKNILSQYQANRLMV